MLRLNFKKLLTVINYYNIEFYSEKSFLLQKHQESQKKDAENKHFVKFSDLVC